MTEPTVIVLYDAAGSAHYTAPASEFARDGLASGELSIDPPAAPEPVAEPLEEVPNGPEVPAPGDDQHPRSSRKRG